MTAEISAALVKELRDRTGAGMMDCKRALQETNGDMDAAVTLLREKGMAQAQKHIVCTRRLLPAMKCTDTRLRLTQDKTIVRQIVQGELCL